MVVWQNIKNQIEIDIIAGEYQKVDKPNKLPSISELAQKYNCGKSTAQKVLEELCKEEIVLNKKRVGYFIKPYARKQLFEKKIGEYEKKATDLICELKNINIDKDMLKKIINSTIDKVYDL